MADEAKKEEEPTIKEEGDDMPELENQEDGAAPNLNRNEKKCRKALMKIGMKQLSGIQRITLKKRDGMIFVIDDPEVLTLENSYAIFGELKFEDSNRQMQMEQARKFAEQTAAKKPEAAATPKVEAAEEPVSEEGLTPDNISIVMEHANCSRAEAVKALHATNDDTVQAVMKINEAS